MPKTLLAVDDSATMRKVLEITFAGEDFRVVGAEGAESAVSRLGEDPAAAVIDVSLGSDDSYALAKEVRSRSPRTAVVLMASRYTPYDSNRGRDAGVDDFIDKPFDTQALIDKVKKAIAAREQARTAAPAAPPPAPLNATAAFGAPPRPLAPPGPPGAQAQAPRAWATQRTHTLSFEGGVPGSPTAAAPQAAPPPAPAPAAAASAPGASAAQPPIMSRTAPSGVVLPLTSAAAPGATAVPPAAPQAMLTRPAPAGGERFSDATSPSAQPRAASTLATTNGPLPGKLQQLGLTEDQVQAVLALSRELVERVVWEVVPALAETLIKEEIARLTREG